MLDPLAWLDDELAALEARGLRRRLTEREGPRYGARFTCAGKSYINFGSNDYLGLAASGELVRAVRKELEGVGWGAGASPLVTGRGEWHARLERQLAEFECAEAALLFPSGYAANVGTISALVGKGDAIFSDAKNHASIIDGCKLSGAQVHVYRHCDVNDLERLLKEHGKSARRRLIVTDGVFSMDGDLAPLEQISPLADDYDCMFMVDAAHATGVCVLSGSHIVVGTLSKALGGHGGFVASSQSVINWLVNRARSYVFSTAAPEAVAIAGCAALAHVRKIGHGGQLPSKAEFLRDTLRARGWNIGNSESQIIPIYLGDPDRTMRAAAKLRDLGLWVPGIRPPSVPEGESLLRVSLTALHTRQMIEQLVEGLETIR